MSMYSSANSTALLTSAGVSPPIMIKRGDDVVIPVGSTIIEKNDELVLVSK